MPIGKGKTVHKNQEVASSTAIFAWQPIVGQATAPGVFLHFREREQQG